MTDLPVELWLMVFEKLEDPAEVLGLRLVCDLFDRLLQTYPPELYILKISEGDSLRPVPGRMALAWNKEGRDLLYQNMQLKQPLVQHFNTFWRTTQFRHKNMLMQRRVHVQLRHRPLVHHTVWQVPIYHRAPQSVPYYIPGRVQHNQEVNVVWQVGIGQLAPFHFSGHIDHWTPYADEVVIHMDRFSVDWALLRS